MDYPEVFYSFRRCIPSLTAISIMTQRLRYIGRVIVYESYYLALAAPLPTDQIDKITTSISNFFLSRRKENQPIRHPRRSQEFAIMRAAAIRSQCRSFRTISTGATRALRIPPAAGRPAARLCTAKSLFSLLPLARASASGNRRYASVAAAVAEVYVFALFTTS